MLRRITRVAFLAIVWKGGQCLNHIAEEHLDISFGMLPHRSALTFIVLWLRSVWQLVRTSYLSSRLLPERRQLFEFSWLLLVPCGLRAFFLPSILVSFGGSSFHVAMAMNWIVIFFILFYSFRKSWE